MFNRIPLLACVFAVAVTTGDPVLSRAEAPAPSQNVVRELYVPFDDLNVVLENQPRRVLLSRAEFDDLLAKAAPSRPEAAPPVAAAVLSGDYEVTVDQDRARIKGVLTLEVLVDGLQPLPLELAGVGVSRAMLDGKSAAIGRALEGGLTLFIEGKGPHTLELDLVTPLTATAAQQMLQFHIPVAATSTMRLSVPGDVEIKSGAKVVSRNFDSTAGRTRFELLASRGETTIVMTLNSHLLRQERAVVAKAVMVDEVTQNYERLHATFSMAVLHKAVDSFRLVIPVGFEVTQVHSPLLARWSVTAGGQNGQVLEVRLREQTTQTEVLNIAAIRAVPPGEAWRFPVIKALDVVGEVSVIGLLLEDRMKVQGIESASLIPVDTTVLIQALPASVFQAEPGAPQIRPVVAYYAPQPEFRLGASFQKPTARLLVTTDQLLTLTEKQQLVRAGFTVLPELEKLFAVDVSVPGAWQVSSVTAGDGGELPIERFAGRIHVQLPKGVTPGETFTFMIRGSCSPADWLSDWKSTKTAFPLFGIAAASRVTGAVAVAIDGDLTVRPQKLERLIPLEENEKERYGLAGVASSLAYRFDSFDCAATFTVERILPRLTAQTYSFLVVRPDLLTAHYELTYEVEQAKAQRLSLSLPAGTPETLSIAGMEGVAIKEYTSRLEGNLRHWTVLLEEARRDTIRLAVDFQQPLGHEVTSLDLPVILADNLVHQAGFIAVEGSPELDVKVTTPLRKVDVGELAAAKYQPGKRLLGTYCFVGESPSVQVSVARHPGHDLPSVLVERAELLTVLGSQGLSQNAARLLLRTKDQSLEVELPAGAQLWAARVDGETNKPQRQDQRLLLSLPAGAESMLHDLQFVYEMPVAGGGFRQKVELVAPRLLLHRSGQINGTEIPIADLTWQLCLPSGYRITDATGTVATDAVRPDELAASRLWSDLYQIGGGVHPLYGIVGVQNRSESELAVCRSRAIDTPVELLSPSMDGMSDDFGRVQAESGWNSTGVGRMGSEEGIVNRDGDVDGDRRADDREGRQTGHMRGFGARYGVNAANGPPNVMAAPLPLPARQGGASLGFWALEGVRSLKIDLQETSRPVAFHSLGADPHVRVTLLSEQRTTALAWGLACAVGLWGVGLAGKPLRSRARYILTVALIATLIPVISGSVLLTQILNPSFTVTAWLVPFYLLAGAFRWMMRRLQPSLLTVPAGATTVLLALVLFAGRSAQAAAPAARAANAMNAGPPVVVPDDAIIVPYDPAFPIGVSGLQQILVPYARYVDLWNRTHPGDTLTAPSTPVPYVISGVVVRATLGGEDHLVLEARADVDVFTEGPVSVPLPLANGVLTRAELDGTPAHLGAVTTQPEPTVEPAGQQQEVEASAVRPTGPILVLSVSGKGRHHLVLAAQMKLDRSGGWRMMRGRLLAAESGVLALTVPEPQTEVQLADVPDRTGYVTTAANETIETSLGPTGRLVLQWRPKVSEGVVDQSLTAQSTAMLDVQEDGIRLSWRVELEFRRSERASFKLDLPSGYLVTQVAGPNVRGWEIAAVEKGQQLQITLLKPAKDHEQFDVHLSRRGAVGSSAWATIDVPAVAIPDAALHHGQLTIRRSPLLELRTEAAQGVSRIDLQTGSAFNDLALNVDSPLGIRPFVTYRFAALPFTVRLAASPAAQHITAKSQMIVRVAERERSLEARINLSVQDRPMYQAALLLPGNLVLDRVSAPGPFEWAVTPQDGRLRLDIVLAAGQTGTVPILISGRLGEAGQLDKVPLPELEVRDVQRQEGDLVVQTDAGWEVKATDLEKCESILLNRVHDWLTPQQLQLTRLALHYENPGYRGHVQLVPLRPLVRCQTISNARVTDRAIEETILLDLTIQRAGIGELSFFIPESMKDARISVPQLRQQTLEPGGAEKPGLLRVRLALQDKVMGQLRVLVENDRILTGEHNRVPIPVVENVQVDQRYALIENNSRSEVEVETQQGLTPVSRQQSEWQRLISVLGGNITSAYLADSNAGEPLLAFRTKDRAIVQTVGARIGLAQTWMSVDASGTYRAVQSYRVDNSTEQFMEIQLPAGAEVWTVRVAGEPVKPTQSADPRKPDHLLIPLVKTAAGDLDYEVLIKYGGQIGELGGLSEVTFPLVRPVNINAELSQVRLYLPERYRWFDFGGSMTQSQDETGLAAGFIAYQTKRAQRLIQAMGDSSSFAKVRAVANLKELESEVEYYQQTAETSQKADKLKQEWAYNGEAIEGAVRQSKEVAKELDKLKVSGDNRSNLGIYFGDQGVARPSGSVQAGEANFAFDLGTSQPAAGQQFDEKWFASNSLANKNARVESRRRETGKTVGGRLGGDGKAQPQAPGQPPPPPQVIDQLKAQREGEVQAPAKGVKKSKSLETLDQYQQALAGQQSLSPLMHGKDAMGQKETRPSQSVELFYDRSKERLGDRLSIPRRQVPATQPALGAGLASLDVDIRHAGAVYRFTAPRGETAITVRVVSRSAIDTLERLGLALLAIVVLWVMLRVAWPLFCSFSARKAWRWLILLGMLSLFTGVLPIAGLGLVVVAVALRMGRTPVAEAA